MKWLDWACQAMMMDYREWRWAISLSLYQIFNTRTVAVYCRVPLPGSSLLRWCEDMWRAQKWSSHTAMKPPTWVTWSLTQDFNKLTSLMIYSSLNRITSHISSEGGPRQYLYCHVPGKWGLHQNQPDRQVDNAGQETLTLIRIYKKTHTSGICGVQRTPKTLWAGIKDMQSFEVLITVGATIKVFWGPRGPQKPVWGLTCKWTKFIEDLRA